MSNGIVRESPLVHVISDSLGDTAAMVVSAAVSQFPQIQGTLGRLSHVKSIEQVFDYLDDNRMDGKPMVVFHTFADESLRERLWEYPHIDELYVVDLLGPAIEALSGVFGEIPIGKPGVIHETDAEYFKRIEAVDYTVNHDDGRGEDDLDDADIVLIGVSRTSKTPLSLFLATRGYKVANIPLVLGVEPPSSLFKVDRKKIFGLMSNARLLSEIRYRRLGTAMDVAESYAAVEKVQEDLDNARALMRKLGCIVIRTDNKAIEETAQEILQYYKAGNGLENLS
ncbi:MAG: kinase/pyrophosphorylase [Actinobacteria bacterium]|nr:kinase/pyrophosphorylase [Actinomycetota bacterium]